LVPRLKGREAKVSAGEAEQNGTKEKIFAGKSRHIFGGFCFMF